MHTEENAYAKAYALLFNAITDSSNAVLRGEVSLEVETEMLKLRRAQQCAEEIIIKDQKEKPGK